MATFIFDATNAALKQWVHVTGVDPDAEPCGTIGDFDIRRLNDYITEAQDLDDTGITAFMVVHAVVLTYLAKMTLRVLDLIASTKRLDDLRILHERVTDPQALGVVAEWTQTVKDAAQHYGVLGKTAATIEDLITLSHVRRDALVIPKILKPYTFAHGKRSKTPLKVNHHILKVWNIASLLEMAQRQPEDGISVVLVRDPKDVAYSFFVFLIVDGENITVWTDMTRPAHPMQKTMTRSRARTRQLQDRMDKLRFPYQLLEFQYDDEGKHVYEIPSTSLTPLCTQAVTIAELGDLEPDQILWIILALDVLSRTPHEKTLSTTAGHLALPSRALPALSVPAKRIRPEDVTTQAMASQMEALNGIPVQGFNTWMEQRYGDKVDPDLLNLTERRAGETQYILPGGDQFAPSVQGTLRHPFDHPGHLSHNEPKVIGMDPMTFGSPEDLEADRLWVARWNQAQAIGVLAHDEFQRRFRDVIDWYDQHVHNNASRIIEHVFKGEWDNRLVQWYKTTKDGFYPVRGFDNPPSNPRNPFVRLFQVPQGRISRQNPIKCFFGDHMATCWVLLAPKNPQELATIAGVPVSDLPELLEYWTPSPPYPGNSLINRSDPLETAVANPWAQLTFNVMLGLSKRTANRLCKDHGRPITWEEDHR